MQMTGDKRIQDSGCFIENMTPQIDNVTSITQCPSITTYPSRINKSQPLRLQSSAGEPTLQVKCESGAHSVNSHS